MKLRMLLISFSAVRDEHHPLVTPDGYVDNLAQAVELFLQHRKL